MPHKPDWPADVARRVYKVLNKSRSIPLRALRSLFETMYFASLQTEEGSPIAFHVVYMDPGDPDPHPPARLVADRWKAIPLAFQLPFTLSTLGKLAIATDPRSSSIAVYHNAEGQVYVWGFVDQTNHYFEFIVHDSDRGPERPAFSRSASWASAASAPTTAIE
jgi:sensor domain DACNV-containing protein